MILISNRKEKRKILIKENRTSNAFPSHKSFKVYRIALNIEKIKLFINKTKPIHKARNKKRRNVQNILRCNIK